MQQIWVQKYRYQCSSQQKLKSILISIISYENSLNEYNLDEAINTINNKHGLW